jgi:inhibitor of cysteine peptidase
MRLVTSAALGLGLLLLAAACGGRGSSNTFELSQGDSGTTLQVAPDDEIVISLESNPTTGYGWHEAEKSQNNGILQLLAKSYESESDAIGSGGVETWTYKAVKAGKTVLELNYLRPFEPDEIAGKFTVTIDVTAS